MGPIIVTLMLTFSLDMAKPLPWLLGKKPSCSCVGRPYRLYSTSDFRSRKESDFPEWLQLYARYSDTAISNAAVNARIRYGNSAHVDNGCRQ